jgi:Arm DNA-binding domain
MTKILTAAAVEKLRARKQRREIPDAGCRGLYLVIGTSGAKSWAFRYRRPDGTTAKLTLGSVDTSPLPPSSKNGEEKPDLKPPVIGGHLRLGDAHTLATEARNQVARGLDPGVIYFAERTKQKHAALSAGEQTYAAMARIFIKRFAKDNRKDWKELARSLGLNPDEDGLPAIPGGIADRWQTHALAVITKADVVAELDRAVTEGRGPTRGNKLLAALKVMWNWHIDRGALEHSPCARVKMPVPMKALRRARRLSDDELLCFWRGLDDAVAAGEVPKQYAALMRFTCLTLTRRDEALLMVGGEVNRDEWIVPAARMGKTGVDFLVLLSAEAKKQLAIAQGDASRAGFVFSLDAGKTALGGVSKWKRRLDKRMLARLKALAHERNDQIALKHWEEIEQLIAASIDKQLSKADRRAAQKKLRSVWWSGHDFRRNGRSYLSKVVSPDIAERTLSHIVVGIRATYDLHSYAGEKRRALQLWAREVERIVGGEPGKVVTMRKRSRS